ncbi:hypothetical protein [Modestobacter versicolor]|uniref:hypothetical protein n=1 Tax=Modestobacter versicolor TaxID=429133 RepID=UPI0034DFC9D0
MSTTVVTPDAEWIASARKRADVRASARAALARLVESRGMVMTGEPAERLVHDRLGVYHLALSVTVDAHPTRP